MLALTRDGGSAVGLADLRLVEQVTGRLTSGRAALAGAASIGWLGLLLGLFIGFFAESGTALVALAVYGLLSGAVFGAVPTTGRTAPFDARKPSTSFEKADRSFAIDLLRLWSQLYASTAGTATTRPSAVMMSASPTGPATVPIEA